MKQYEYKPDDVTYNILASSFCKQNRPSKALDIVKIMEKEYLPVSTKIYGPILNV